MKIAINGLGPSKIKMGIGVYVVNLVKELQNLDKKNKYLLFVGNENQNLFKQNSNFILYNIGIFNTYRLLRVFWEQFVMPFVLLKEGVQILHSPSFVSPILKTTKQVLTIHDLTFFTHPQYHLASKVRYFRNMIPISTKMADIIIADSENTKQDIIKVLGVDPNKIKTIYLGTNFRKQKNAKKWIWQKYGINQPFILFVGMLEPRKNIPNLIRAFAQLAPKIKHKLVIVGKKGWRFIDIFRLVKELDLKERVIFTGYVPDKDLEYFYSAAECFVYPSYYEGFGIPIIEAMACECPVVTSNNSSLKEITDNLLLSIKNPNHPNEISKRIFKVLKSRSLHKQLKRSGLRKVRDFNWRNTANETLKTYEAVYKDVATKSD